MSNVGKVYELPGMETGLDERFRSSLRDEGFEIRVMGLGVFGERYLIKKDDSLHGWADKPFARESRFCYTRNSPELEKFLNSYEF
jgi:hypothetical protein